ncbi:hypothetical protein B0H11DRAFT_2184485 [Mycena galericulata]|nr:hypothetical protein B0H11DRAFT_2184485 [Mycena galericulata]
MSSIPTPTPPTPRTPRRRPFSPVASRSPGTPRKRVPPRSTRLQGIKEWKHMFEETRRMIVKQAGEKGISAIEINEDNANDPTVWRKAEKSAQLVYISPEMALSDHFGRFAGAGGSKWTGKPSARRQGFERELPEALQFIPGEFGLPVVIVILESSQVGSKVCRNTGVVVEEREPEDFKRNVVGLLVIDGATGRSKSGYKMGMATCPAKLNS